MKLEELTRKSHDAARVRAYQTHPDVIALWIERVRTCSASLIWAGVVLGLAFTMTNVQQFAANGAAAGSLPWLSAWLLDPMVSLVLIGVLVAEQVTARWELPTPVWARRTKWFALSATYVMNTWQPWSVLSASGIVLHSVPPLLVFTAVEGGPAMREALTKAVARSLAATGPNATTPVLHDATLAVNPPSEVHQPTPSEVHESRSRRSVNGRKPASGKGSRTGGRVLFADYLALAREHRPAELAVVTPVWCRQVTGCSAGTSVRVAAALNAEPPAAVTAESVPIEPVTASVTTFANPVPDTTPTGRESEAA